MSAFEVSMKPTGMSRTKNGRRRPEFSVVVEATDSSAAVFAARDIAEAEGFNGYAITKIKEVSQ